MVSKVVNDIKGIMNSNSAAFFGVSSKSGKLGNVLMQGFLDIGFKGKLYPINPNAREILGIKAYSSLNEIDEPIDLAIIALHPKIVLKVVEDCVKKQVKGIIVFSSGFREKNQEGKELENKLLELIKNTNTMIVGPNCMGIYSPSTNLSFFPDLYKEPGSVGFISQSGSIASFMAYLGPLNGFGYSRIISIGNAVDLSFNDFLEYLGEDSETKMICAYLEGLEDGNRFIELVKKICPKKPIIIWKVGDTVKGSEAAQSHTGSIGGSKQLWDAIYAQTGLIKVNHVRELIEHIMAFINPYLPKSNRVAIISGPGGPAVSAVDACEKFGLKIAEISQESAEKIAKLIPEFGTSVKNPIDISLTGSMNPDLYQKTVEIVGSDDNVDLILIYVGTLQKIVVRGLIKAQEIVKKPIAIVEGISSLMVEIFDSMKSFYAPIKTKRYPETMRRLFQSSITLHPNEYAAAKVFMNLVKYSKYLNQNLK